MLRIDNDTVVKDLKAKYEQELADLKSQLERENEETVQQYE
jgi:hypothetical protein